MRIIVTGGSGRLGSYVIEDLSQHGHEVLNADSVRPGDAPRVGPPGRPFVHADVTSYGDMVSVMAGFDAVIHLAAITNPFIAPEYRVFEMNMTSTWNVLQAAEVHGIRKLVLASSINAIGAGHSLGVPPPLYFPVDEEHPTRAKDAYSQSKWLGEQMADAFSRRRDFQIASLRFHALWDLDMQAAHRESGDKTGQQGHTLRAYWGWVDRRDAARACRLSIENEWSGHQVFFITAADTTLEVPTEQALETFYSGVPLRRPLPGFQSAIDISKAERVLGWIPEHSWREASGD